MTGKKFARPPIIAAARRRLFIFPETCELRDDIPRGFGWWIESTDEEIYGPVTKATLTRFLSEGLISPNTAIRHCTDANFAPVADQGISAGA